MALFCESTAIMVYLKVEQHINLTFFVKLKDILTRIFWNVKKLLCNNAPTRDRVFDGTDDFLNIEERLRWWICDSKNCSKSSENQWNREEGTAFDHLSDHRHGEHYRRDVKTNSTRWIKHDRSVCKNCSGKIYCRTEGKLEKYLL